MDRYIKIDIDRKFDRQTDFGLYYTDRSQYICLGVAAHQNVNQILL